MLEEGDPLGGSQVRSSPSDEASWQPHSRVSQLSFSPGRRSDGEPYAVVDVRPEPPVPPHPGGEPGSGDLRTAWRTATGDDIEVGVENPTTLWRAAMEDHLVHAHEEALANLVDGLAQPRHDHVPCMILARRDSSFEGGCLVLDLRDDPRSHIAWLSEAPALEPPFAAFEAEARERFHSEMPGVFAIEPRVLQYVRAGGGDPTAAFGASGATLEALDARTQKTTIPMAGTYPSRVQVLRLAAPTGEVRAWQIIYQEPSARSPGGALRHVYLDGEAQIRFAQNWVVDEPTGTLLRQTWLDAAGNVERVTEDNALFMPRWSLQVGPRHFVDDSLLERLRLLTQHEGGVHMGMLDSGVDYNHPELGRNLPGNAREGVLEDGLDQDDNGLVDDFLGWDVEDDDRFPYDSGISHGTHVAGILCRGSGDIRITPVRTVRAAEHRDEGIRYLVDMRVRGINISMGSSLASEAPRWAALTQAIAESPGVLFVSSAGNDYGQDNDSHTHHPALRGLSNVISVAAVDELGRLAPFSNYGLETVHVAAPGNEIVSTLPGGGVGAQSGTLMAAPFVANLAAKLWLLAPGLSVAEVRAIVFETVDARQDLQDRVASGGIVNPERAMRVAVLVDRASLGHPPETTALDLDVTVAERERLVEIAANILAP